jgi:hypothetical protein
MTENEYYINPCNFAINHNTLSQIGIIDILHRDQVPFEIKEPSGKALENTLKTIVNCIDSDNMTMEIHKFLHENILNEEWKQKYVEYRQMLVNNTHGFISTETDKTEDNSEFELLASKTIYSLHFEQIPNNNGRILEVNIIFYLKKNILGY